jgi:hypothetical protein
VYNPLTLPLPLHAQAKSFENCFVSSSGTPASETPAFCMRTRNSRFLDWARMRSVKERRALLYVAVVLVCKGREPTVSV